MLTTYGCGEVITCLLKLTPCQGRCSQQGSSCGRIRGGGGFSECRISDASFIGFRVIARISPMLMKIEFHKAVCTLGQGCHDVPQLHCSEVPLIAGGTLELQKSSMARSASRRRR